MRKKLKWEMQPVPTLHTAEAMKRLCMLQTQGKLCTDLFEKGYSFIVTAKFQSDPLERRISQYRQMSGGSNGIQNFKNGFSFESFSLITGSLIFITKV